MGANFIAYICSCFISYQFQMNFVFRTSCGNYFKYYVIYLSSFFIQMFGVYALVEYLAISKEIAPILILFVTVPYNYLINKFWNFKMEDQADYSHTFVICAYQECHYLEECILSIVHQKLFSSVIMVTSTDNDFIRSLANKYGIKLYVRKGKSDIQKDWNFGYKHAKTDLVTLVHQDDIYDEFYLYDVMNYFLKYNNVSFVCTDYYALKNGEKTIDINSRLKRVLKFPLRFSLFNWMSFFKVMSLSFGNSINCPSVTYNKRKLGNGNLFTSKLKFSLDWDTFLKIAMYKGRIGYINKKLICYRIHEEATTMKFVLDDDKRYQEDFYCFLQVWPRWIAKIFMKFYEKAGRTYINLKD